MKQLFTATKAIIVFCSGVVALASSAQTTINVSSMTSLVAAMKGSNQNIIMAPGTYALTDLPLGSRLLDVSGSHNTIDLSGVKINALVGATNATYFTVSGDSNIIRNGIIEDYFASGLTTVTDFSAFNHDRNTLAYGLKGAAVMTIYGNHNLVVGTELTIRGSFPYGYGSNYGIGSVNTFGLNKRCGLLITGINGGGVGNTLDSIKLHQRAFGHGIYMQEGADSTLIKNTLVEGTMRLSADIYNDTNSYDLPYLSGYLFPTGDTTWKLPFIYSYPIPLDVMYPLSEDGIRMYANTGSITVENSTVKQMRGGIRLYLGGTAIVRNSQAIDCGEVNFNMSAGGIITGSTGNFSYAPLSDFRLSRSNQNMELTILPSPNATGPHNIADIQGNSHTIVFHRSPGPLDTTTRAIVVYGNKSTINNETEYAIILNTGTSGNKVTSCGPVTDNGTNTITLKSNCSFAEGPTRIQVSPLNASTSTQIDVYSISGRLLARGTNRQETIARARTHYSQERLFIVNVTQGRKHTANIILDVQP